MSFEIVRDPELVARRYNSERLEECTEMFRQLSADPERLTAKIDISISNARRYAKKLGYKVKTSKIDNTSCYIWIDADTEGSRGDSTDA